MRINFTIEGTSDLMTHNPIAMFTAKNGGLGVKGGKKEPTPEEQAEMGCYRLSDGSCGIPTLAIRGALIAAAKDFKVTGKRYSLAKLLQGCDVEPMEYLQIQYNGHPITEYGIDIRRYKSKVTGGAGIIHRPKYPAGWRLSFDVVVDDALFKLDMEQMRETLTAVLDDAGRRVGIGSYRPANSGWFGRFKVV